MRLKFIVKNDNSFIQREQRIFAISKLSINKPLFTTCDTDYIMQSRSMTAMAQ
ncbi:MAG: hypothetical protein LBJ13_01320 [Puniceicoccales bacterium]|nr:hypothetical protein [Puniceicoccales bacterium]